MYYVHIILCSTSPTCYCPQTHLCIKKGVASLISESKRSGFSGVDILVTSEWPKGVYRHSKGPVCVPFWRLNSHNSYRVIALQLMVLPLCNTHAHTHMHTCTHAHTTHARAHTHTHTSPTLTSDPLAVLSCLLLPTRFARVITSVVYMDGSTRDSRTCECRSSKV